MKYFIVIVVAILVCCVGIGISSLKHKEPEISILADKPEGMLVKSFDIAMPEVLRDSEIQVGQVWKLKFNGTRRRIIETGEKHIIFEYSDGNHRKPTVLTREDFLEDHFLVEQKLESPETDPYRSYAHIHATEPNAPPVWGKGELPEAYLKTFGNSNGARLAHVQNQIIDKHGKTIEVHNNILAELAKRVIALEGKDPDE